MHSLGRSKRRFDLHLHCLICAPSPLLLPPFHAQRTGTFIPPAEAIRGRIEFKDVTFAYPTRAQNKVLHNFNLTVRFIEWGVVLEGGFVCVWFKFSLSPF